MGDVLLNTEGTREYNGTGPERIVVLNQIESEFLQAKTALFYSDMRREPRPYSFTSSRYTVRDCGPKRVDGHHFIFSFILYSFYFIRVANLFFVAPQMWFVF